MFQIGGGNCSLCGSPNTNKSTCPCNPNAINPNYKKHPLSNICLSKKNQRGGISNKPEHLSDVECVDFLNQWSISPWYSPWYSKIYGKKSSANIDYWSEINSQINALPNKDEHEQARKCAKQLTLDTVCGVRQLPTELYDLNLQLDELPPYMKQQLLEISDDKTIENFCKSSRAMIQYCEDSKQDHIWKKKLNDILIAVSPTGEQHQISQWTLDDLKTKYNIVAPCWYQAWIIGREKLGNERLKYIKYTANWIMDSFGTWPHILQITDEQAMGLYNSTNPQPILLTNLGNTLKDNNEINAIKFFSSCYSDPESMNPVAALINVDYSTNGTLILTYLVGLKVGRDSLVKNSKCSELATSEVIQNHKSPGVSPSGNVYKTADPKYRDYKFYLYYAEFNSTELWLRDKLIQVLSTMPVNLLLMDGDYYQI